FSRLHANELAFGMALDGALTRAVARRMLVYPETLEQDPLLRLGLQALAADGPSERAFYALLLPLGRLQTLLLEAQDHLAVLLYLRAHAGLAPDVPRLAAPPEWDALAAQAEREQVSRSTSNQFGLDDQRWADTWREHAAARYGALDDRAYLGYIAASAEWD